MKLTDLLFGKDFEISLDGPFKVHALLEIDDKGDSDTIDYDLFMFQLSTDSMEMISFNNLCLTANPCFYLQTVVPGIEAVMNDPYYNGYGECMQIYGNKLLLDTKLVLGAIKLYSEDNERHVNSIKSLKFAITDESGTVFERQYNSFIIPEEGVLLLPLIFKKQEVKDKTVIKLCSTKDILK